MTAHFRTPVLVTGMFLAASCLAGVTTSPAAAKPDMTDQAISDKIDDELLGDPGVVSTRIDVRTANGIVTLSGSVNNMLAKERVARIAEIVKGVRSIVNRIQVNPTDRTDPQRYRTGATRRPGD